MISLVTAQQWPPNIPQAILHCICFNMKSNIKQLRSVFPRATKPTLHFAQRWSNVDPVPIVSTNGRPRKHAILAHRWLKVGPPSATLAQPLTNSGPMSRVCREARVCFEMKTGSRQTFIHHAFKNIELRLVCRHFVKSMTNESSHPDKTFIYH